MKEGETLDIQGPLGNGYDLGKIAAVDYDIPCYLSLEDKMACGIGACLACVCKSTGKDEHSQVNNKRVCKEGPVFNAKEVEL